MPEAKKKIMVKVPKKEIAAETKVEGYVPKGLTKEVIKKIDNTSEFNKNRIEIESMAKTDSISGAKKAKFEGKDLVDQRRAGNKAANETRKEGGVPQVMRGKEHVNDSNLADKYSTGTSTSTRDSYSRANPLEKDMPKVKKIMVKLKKA